MNNVERFENWLDPTHELVIDPFYLTFNVVAGKDSKSFQFSMEKIVEMYNKWHNVVEEYDAERVSIVGALKKLHKDHNTMRDELDALKKLVGSKHE